VELFTVTRSGAECLETEDTLRSMAQSLRARSTEVSYTRLSHYMYAVYLKTPRSTQHTLAHSLVMML
jgi:hypothetical protein